MQKRLLILAFVMLTGGFGVAFASGSSYQIEVDGLACPFCAYGIEKELNRIEHVADVETHIGDGIVIVTMIEDEVLDERAATDAIERAGFTLKGFERIRCDDDG